MISEPAAADLIHYLHAATGLPIKENQAAVWADYLNANAGDTMPRDLRDAARLAITNWARDGRKYQIDVTHVAQAVKQARRARWEAFEQANPGLYPPEGLTVGQELEWIKTLMRVVKDGETDRARATQAATRQIQQDTKPQQLTAPF